MKEKFRKKLKLAVLLLVTAIFILGSGLMPGCLRLSSMTEEDYDNLPPLFNPPEFKKFDLAEALNEAQSSIERYSIFWRASKYPEILSIFQKYSIVPDVSKDPTAIQKSVLVNFFAFLSVPESQIPNWAWDLLKKEIAQNRGKVGYSFINEVYRQVIQDPQYSHLQEPDRKEALLKFMIGDGEKGTGLIGALGDPFTWYVSASAVKAGYWDELIGNYVGIGIRVGLGEAKRFVIKKVTKGSSADRAGLKVGDTILAVDRKSPLKCSREQLNSYFYGAPGTYVLLTIKQFDGTIKDVRVIREQVRERYVSSWPSLELPQNRGNTSELLPFFPPLRDKEGDEIKDILYLKIRAFKPYVVDDIRTILKTLNLDDYIGIIIDLRDNAGGIGDKDVADFFLKDDEVMAIEILNDGTKRIFSLDKEDLDTEIPIAILIGRDNQFFMGTWSAGEVFAAAMRDNGRAVLIGEKTPGKGTAVSYAELSGGNYGALVVGSLIWLTPSGEWIERRDEDRDGYYESGGVEPDIEVAWSDEDFIRYNQNPGYDPTIFRAIEYLQELWEKK